MCSVEKYFHSSSSVFFFLPHLKLFSFSYMSKNIFAKPNGEKKTCSFFRFELFFLFRYIPSRRIIINTFRVRRKEDRECGAAFMSIVFNFQGEVISRCRWEFEKYEFKLGSVDIEKILEIFRVRKNLLLGDFTVNLNFVDLKKSSRK